MTALAYTLTTVSLSFSAFAAFSVSDIMSTRALSYTSSTFFPSVEKGFGLKIPQ